jgi:hypothetical protein
MKIYLTLFSSLSFLILGSSLNAQTLDWGSQAFSALVDSKGNSLDETFVFELGSFAAGFTPTESNVGSWLVNWSVFDRANYSQENGVFTGQTNMLDNGTSDSIHLTQGALSFEGFAAYIWIRKGDLPIEGSEWMVVRSTEWTFPTANPGCCDNETPVQWSVSDLASSDTPLWGHQNGVNGSGVFTSVGGPYDLQTFTFVPEPSSAVLAALAGGFAMIRRRRTQN